MNRLFLVLAIAACTPAPRAADTGRARGDTADASVPDTTGPTAGVTLALDSTTYHVGSTARLRITNDTDDPLAFNACSSRVVERKVGSAWVAYDEPRRVCNMLAQLVPAHGSAVATTDLPKALASAPYRIVLTFSVQRTAPTSRSTPVRAVSPTFQVVI